MKQDIDAIERHLKAAASANARPINGVPDFYTSELAIRLLLANLVGAPVEIFERARQEHRDEAHGGFDGGAHCQPCGYIDAAVYGAKNPGRSLAADFLDADPTGKPA